MTIPTPLYVASLCFVGLSTLCAPASYAQEASTAGLEVMIGNVGQRDANGAVLVELRFLNGTDRSQSLSLPDHVDARLTGAGESQTVRLDYAGDADSHKVIPVDGFTRVRYRLTSAEGLSDGVLLSIPAWRTQQVAIAMEATAPASALATDLAPAGGGPSHLASQQAAGEETAQSTVSIPPPPGDRAAGNDFIDNLSAYQPIYAVYGPGTNSAGRIQLSLKYQIFGSDQDEKLPNHWQKGLYFGYTQRMFWDLDSYSMPFRNIDFQPEIFYLSPSRTISNGMTVAAQAGIRHESNGRDGDQSRSINSLYAAPMAAFALSDGMVMSLAPGLSFYIGDRSDNPDIERYRGKLSLLAEIGREDGWRLSTQSRFNPGSGKGAISADISYPLPKLWKSGPQFYLFGQSFWGYGENLLDYRRSTTRFRIGFALVR